MAGVWQEVTGRQVDGCPDKDFVLSSTLRSTTKMKMKTLKTKLTCEWHGRFFDIVFRKRIWKNSIWTRIHKRGMLNREEYEAMQVKYQRMILITFALVSFCILAIGCCSIIMACRHSL